jgi:hypothetical protein
MLWVVVNTTRISRSACSKRSNPGAIRPRHRIVIKRTLLFLLFLSSPLYCQVQTFPGGNGIGHSTLVCHDRDGDGYGVGLTAVVNTTAGGAISSGQQTVTPASMTGAISGTIAMGSSTITNVDTPTYALQVGETVSGASIPAGTTITALPPRAGGSYGLGSIAISQAATASATETINIGIGVGSVLRYDLVSNMERIVVSSVTATTFTATFALSHGSGASISDQGCLGRDADDSDALVWTASDALTKWTTLAAFFKHVGYAASSHIYYINNSTGSDTGSPPNCRDNAAAPCATTAYINTSLVPDDIVAYRTGNQTRIDVVSGTTGHPIVYIAYPGETPVIDAVAFANDVINADTKGNFIVDGFKFKNAGYIHGGTQDGAGSAQAVNISIRHVEAIDEPTGLNAVIQFFNGLVNFTIEDSVAHDATNSHGIYEGSRDVQSSNVTIQRNLVFNVDVVGIQWNGGSLTNGKFLQNVIYNAGNNCFDFEEGPSGALVADNLCFNSTNGILMQSYDGAEGASFCGVSGTAPCVCNPPNLHSICPTSQNNDIFENNTIYGTGINGYDGTSASDFQGFKILQAVSCTTATCRATNFDNNTFRNNIVVSDVENLSTQHVPFVFADLSNGQAYTNCPSGAGKCAEWFATSTFINTLGFLSDGDGGQNMFYAGAAYTCSQASSVATITGRCSMADPSFASASQSLASTPLAFDFRLLNVSPALHVGTVSASSSTSYDLAGRAFTGTGRSLGALERNPYSFGWNPQAGMTLQSVTPADNTSCNNSAGPPVPPYTQSCDTSGTPGPYPFRSAGAGIVNGWSGGVSVTKPGAEQLLVMGGGHTTYGGSQVYSINLSGATPTISVPIPPSYINSADVTCSPTNYDGSPKARQNYGMPTYMPNVDRVLIFSGALYCGNGDNFGDTWLLNPNTTGISAYAEQDPTACPTACGGSIGGYQSFYTGSRFAVNPQTYSAYDPVTGMVFSLIGNVEIAQYNPQNNSYIYAANTIGEVSGCSVATNCQNAFIDPQLHAFWVMGNSKAYQWNISTPLTYPLPFSDSSSSVTNCGTLLAAGGPGLFYDQAIGQLVGYPGESGATIYEMNMSALNCTAVTPPGTAPASGPNLRGIYGRLGYFPSQDIAVLVNDYSVNATILSLNAPDPSSTRVPARVASSSP